jgi:hypothetical protein
LRKKLLAFRQVVQVDFQMKRIFRTRDSIDGAFRAVMNLLLLDIRAARGTGAVIERLAT